MPQRHDSGSSGSGGSFRSSGGSSWRPSRSSWSYGSSQGDGPSSPEQQILGWIVLGVMLLIVAGSWINNQIQASNARRQQAEATQTIQAITLQDLAEMHSALDSRIPEWKKISDGAVHRVSASDAGFKPDSNTKEVNYGYCTGDYFYIYVIEESRPSGFTLADSEGYAYTPGSYPTACLPPNWNLVKVEEAAPDWYFVTLSTSGATQAARGTNMPEPTATPITPTPTPGKQ